MTPQELRASILQQAIQGELVEQRPEEGTGEELFQQIQAEKQALIKAGKIKKEKPLPEITDNEIPFEIPDTWKWARFGSVVKKLTDGSHNPPPNSGYGYPVISAKNVKNGLITFDNVDRYTDEYGFLKENPRTNIIRGDIIMGIIGGSIGNIAIYTHEEKVIAQRSIAIIGSMIDTDYCVSVLKSPLMQNAMQTSAAGSAQGGVYLGTLSNFLIPLPPLEEQKRIAVKLEEILPLVDRYEAAWSKLEEFNKLFPGDMQKSILQLAIQGKLVEQRSEEGTGEKLFQQIQVEKQALIKAGKIKKEKPLPDITDDEIPFDIPDTWKWVRLRELGFFSSGKTPTMGEAKYWANGTVPWITSKDMKKKYLDWSEMQITQEAAQEMRMYQPNTILMVVRSGILKRLLPVAILTGESTINQDIKAFSLHLPEMAEYVYYILKGMETYILKEYRKQVTTVDSLRFEEFQNMPVPIPPRAEQKRIIAKLEEILPLCDRLK